MTTRIPSIIDAVEHRREAYGLTKQEWAFILDMQPSHYSEFTRGQRGLPANAMAICFAHGVPAEALFERRAALNIHHIRSKLMEKNT